MWGLKREYAEKKREHEREQKETLGAEERICEEAKVTCKGRKGNM